LSEAKEDSTEAKQKGEANGHSHKSEDQQTAEKKMDEAIPVVNGISGPVVDDTIAPVQGKPGLVGRFLRLFADNDGEAETTEGEAVDDYFRP